MNSVKITVFVATMTHFLFSRSFNFDDIKYNLNCMHILTETRDAHSEGVWLLGDIDEFCMMKIIDGNLNLTEKSGS